MYASMPDTITSVMCSTYRDESDTIIISRKISIILYLLRFPKLSEAKHQRHLKRHPEEELEK
ncbi:hypothetical protein E2C01_055087 [Portunus trituberculatus]|uniref:Uncharacterized protein n=1 Tax=Portunus trituberculatus TaxID=210409 RepID=A0A5B7GUC9_PORTR|nr:hypothetical protein [Portunus trituberculatus]